MWTLPLPWYSVVTFTTTVMSWVSAHGRLNITCDFRPAWVLIITQDINSIRLYRSCYIDPLKCGTWVLARDTTVHSSANSALVAPASRWPPFSSSGGALGGIIFT